MLNLNCSICAELFIHSDDVHITFCGHMFHFNCLMQWINRSHTCPQCRNRLTEKKIFRVYFNLANLDTSCIDVGSLQEQLDTLKLTLQMKEKEIKKAENEIQSLKESQKKSMKTITALEGKIMKMEFTILSYAEQMKILKAETKMTEDLRKEVKRLQQQIETMDGISAILTSTTNEVDVLLQNETDRKRLCTWVVTLKRELRNCDGKKTNLRNVLGVTQNKLRRETDEKKQLEERISQLESECYQLNDKIIALQPSASRSSSTSKSSRHSLPVPTDTNFGDTAFRKTDEKRLDLTPGLQENIRKIEQSDSPYLNIRSSSIGLLPYGFKRNTDTSTLSRNNAATALTTTKLATLKISPSKTSKPVAGAIRKTSSDITEKYSIFKRPRLALSSMATSGTTKSQPSNLVFNGFGGSDKIDPFARNPSDDEVEVINETPPKNAFDSNTNKPKNFRIKRPISTIGSSVSERLKSGGLRNFKVQK